MTRAQGAGGALAAVLVLLAVAGGRRALEHDVEPAAATAITPPAPAEAAGNPAGYIHGRVTLLGGATYEGRLRWGGDEEACWGDFFNGTKAENPWVAHVPAEQLPKERRAIGIFGVEIAEWERPVGLGRPFMARFGDIARIEARGVEVRVTLKSGTVHDLDRFAAGDVDDGVRAWDGRRGVVDLDPRTLCSIELLPAPGTDAAPSRLHGTVLTRQRAFTGFVQWNWKGSVGTDLLHGRAADGELALRFDAIRSIARQPPGGCLVTLQDGREIFMSGTTDVGPGNRGIAVEESRHGRVLIAWDAFERADFSPGGTGPAYEDFPPGSALTGGVTRRDGRRLTGRLVYDLDESETTDTLDAPSGGVTYTIPLGLVASIAPSGGGGGARVTLHDGEELQLERAGDLGDGNAGLLVFVAGRQPPEYVPWADVEQVELDRPPAVPGGSRQRLGGHAPGLYPAGGGGRGAALP